jgi:hypothetical protein
MKGTLFICYKFIVCLFILSSAECLSLTAQIPSNLPKINTDTIGSSKQMYYKNQTDLIDLGFWVLHKNPESRLDSSGVKNTHLYFSVAPVVEFTIATGFSPGIAGNVAFRTSANEITNTSSILGAIKYTQKKQFIVPLQSSFWTPGNNFNLLGDWRYLHYPQDSYGFGAYTTLNDKYIITFKQLRMYETLLHNVRKNIYFGLGYQLDRYWGITESEIQAGRITDFEKYGFNKTSTASGIVLDFIYDSRENSINPEGGSYYANFQFLQNSRWLGANTNWNSVMIDLRKYIKMPFHMVLALWFYSVFIVSGNPPYLDLPGTGSDTYSNTGRGYEQSRFIGKKMIDLETELRFNLSRNGLVGGVIFGDAESLSELGNNKFEAILPAIGLGLRIKFNKFSGTNACIDYGIGTKGSRGFVGNLGEVF